MKATRLLLLQLCLMIIGTPFFTLEAREGVKRPLKVLIATYVFPKLSETFVINQAVGLLQQGLDVSIWAKAPMLKEEDAPHEVVKTYKLLKRTYYGSLPPDIHSYDVIICQFGPLGNEFLRAKKAYKFKAKIVTFFRGFDISQHLNGNRHAYDNLLKKGDLIVTNCNYFRQRLLRIGSDPRKTLIHYSAIDCDVFPYSEHTPSSDTIEIVSVGRLVEKKGMDDLIKALYLVSKVKKKVHLTIIGDGDEAARYRLRELVHRLGIEKLITFAGWCTQKEIAAYLQRADLFVLASKTGKMFDQDAIPNALKEAMSSGLPVITTRHGGIPELVTDGVNGCLANEGNVEHIARCMLYLADNPDVRIRYGLEGRRIVERLFDIKNKGRELADLVEKLHQGYFSRAVAKR